MRNNPSLYHFALDRRKTKIDHNFTRLSTRYVT